MALLCSFSLIVTHVFIFFTLFHANLRQEKIWDAASPKPSLTPSAWYDWAKEPNLLHQFHKSIMESKKQLPALASSINKPVEFCLWYYYHTYKPKKELYAPLKRLMNDVKETYNSDECAACEEGGELVCCETCPDSVSVKCGVYFYYISYPFSIYLHTHTCLIV